MTGWSSFGGHKVRHAPGHVRDAIVDYLSSSEIASIGEIQQALATRIGEVPASSVRSYLNLNTPGLFKRMGPGQYRLADGSERAKEGTARSTSRIGLATLIHADCFAWLKSCEPRSFHAVITDPPYGVLEYTSEQQMKLRAGQGGVWRVPPSFDGHRRSPLPRFTILNAGDHAVLADFFRELGGLLLRATVPGANILVASNPLLSHVVASSMVTSGLELRGNVIRLVMTMRGGDRPKNAHDEFPNVSVMPRSKFEPWLCLRHPLDGRVQDNLRTWGTGGFRRPSASKPFADVITSAPTPMAEKRIAPHPSLKPQAFLRELVQASLPLGEGVILDPFAGSGSTLAAANAVGYSSVGVERDEEYVRLATDAIPSLASLRVKAINPV